MRRLAVAPAIDAAEQERLLAAVIASVGGPPAENELQPLALLDLPRVAVELLEPVRMSNVVNVNGLAREQEIIFAPRLNVLDRRHRRRQDRLHARLQARLPRRRRGAATRRRLQRRHDAADGDGHHRHRRRRAASAIDLTQPGPARVPAGIAVFDGRCADVYATRETVAYTPTPLRIFDRLASAQLELRSLVDARLAALERARPAFSEIPADTQGRGRSSTGSRRRPTSLRSSATPRSTVRRSRAWPRSSSSWCSSKQAGPEALAARATREAAAVAALADRVEELETGLGADAAIRLAQVRAAVTATTEAVEVRPRRRLRRRAAGGHRRPRPWRVLWQAAREFAAHSCNGEFPPKQGDVCPLCQQRIGAEAELRLARFDAFVQGAIERQAEAARTALAAELAARARLNPAEVVQLAGVGVAALAEPNLHEELSDFLEVAARRAAALAAGADAPDLPAAPLADLRALVAAREADATFQRTLVDPEEARARRRGARAPRAAPSRGAPR